MGGADDLPADVVTDTSSVSQDGPQAPGGPLPAPGGPQPPGQPLTTQQQFQELRDLILGLGGRLDRLEAQEAMALPKGFSPHVVSTWKNVEVPQVRTLIRAEVGKALREYSLPHTGARSFEQQALEALETLDDALAALKPDPAENAELMVIIHKQIISLTGNMVLGPWGKSYRDTYVKRAKICTVQGFDVKTHSRFVEQIEAAAKAAGDMPDSARAAYSRDRAAVSLPRGRERDYDRRNRDRDGGRPAPGKGGKGGKGRSQ